MPRMSAIPYLGGGSQSDTMSGIATHWHLNGRCYRRLNHRYGVPNGSRASGRSHRLPTAPDVLDHLRMKGQAEKLPNCDALAGSPCLQLPVFEGLVLSFRGSVVLEFSKRCKQTRLLKAFQLAAWPNFIEYPLGDNTQRNVENGHSDIVYELNHNQKPRQQIHLWCKQHCVYWEFVGTAPARRPSRESKSPLQGK